MSSEYAIYTATKLKARTYNFAAILKSILFHALLRCKVTLRNFKQEKLKHCYKNHNFGSSSQQTGTRLY